jgi:IclR family transcriptional regulator, pca regulon regulatory protein
VPEAGAGLSEKQGVGRAARSPDRALALVDREIRRAPLDIRYSRSLDIGLAVLQHYRKERVVLGIIDVADILELGRSTTHRYLATLMALGVLDQRRDRRYLLAPSAMQPGMAVLDEIAAKTDCDPVLRELRGKTGHTVSLGVLDESCATYVRRFHAHFRGQHEADLNLRAGAHIPLHCTALGKALLASVSREERSELLRGLPLCDHGPKTITSKKALVEEIERVREAGVAISDEELAAGIRAVAVSVPVSFRGHRLAIEVSVPASARSAMRLRALGLPLRAAAQRIAKQIPTDGEDAAANDLARSALDQ